MYRRVDLELSLIRWSLGVASMELEFFDGVSEQL